MIITFLSLSLFTTFLTRGRKCPLSGWERTEWNEWNNVGVREWEMEVQLTGSCLTKGRQKDWVWRDKETKTCERERKRSVREKPKKCVREIKKRCERETGEREREECDADRNESSSSHVFLSTCSSVGSFKWVKEKETKLIKTQQASCDKGFIRNGLLGIN